MASGAGRLPRMNHPRRRIRGRLTITRPAHLAGDDAQAIARARDVPTGAAQPSLNTRPRCRRRPPGSPLPATRFPTQWLPAHQALSQKGISHDVPHQPNRPRLVELRRRPQSNAGVPVYCFPCEPAAGRLGIASVTGVLATPERGKRVGPRGPSQPWRPFHMVLVCTEQPVRARCCCSRWHDIHVQRTLGQHYRRAKVQQLRRCSKKGRRFSWANRISSAAGRLVPHRAVTPIAE